MSFLDNMTPTVERIVKLAAIEADKDKCFVGTNHILIGMVLEGHNGAGLMLKNAGFTAEGLRNGVAPTAQSRSTI